jgi:hypothetical protein
MIANILETVQNMPEMDEIDTQSDVTSNNNNSDVNVNILSKQSPPTTIITTSSSELPSATNNTDTQTIQSQNASSSSSSTAYTELQLYLEQHQQHSSLDDCECDLFLLRDLLNEAEGITDPHPSLSNQSTEGNVNGIDALLTAHVFDETSNDWAKRDYYLDKTTPPIINNTSNSSSNQQPLPPSVINTIDVPFFLLTPPVLPPNIVESQKSPLLVSPTLIPPHTGCIPSRPMGAKKRKLMEGFSFLKPGCCCSTAAKLQNVLLST